MDPDTAARLAWSLILTGIVTTGARRAHRNQHHQDTPHERDNA